MLCEYLRYYILYITPSIEFPISSFCVRIYILSLAAAYYIITELAIPYMQHGGNIYCDIYHVLYMYG